MVQLAAFGKRRHLAAMGPATCLQHDSDENHVTQSAADTSHPTKRRGPLPMRPQSLEILKVDNAQLNIRTVEQLVGKSKASILRDIKAMRFPAGTHLSSRCTRWLSNDIRDYLAAVARHEQWQPKKSN